MNEKKRKKKKQTVILHVWPFIEFEQAKVWFISHTFIYPYRLVFRRHCRVKCHGLIATDITIYSHLQMYRNWTKTEKKNKINKTKYKQLDSIYFFDFCIYIHIFSMSMTRQNYSIKKFKRFSLFRMYSWFIYVWMYETVDEVEMNRTIHHQSRIYKFCRSIHAHDLESQSDGFSYTQCLRLTVFIYIHIYVWV